MNSRYAFLIGVLLSLIFDVVQIFLSRGNSFLFFVGGLILFITGWGLYLNIKLAVEDYRIKWMMWYSIPVALLTISLTKGLEELNNKLAETGGVEPVKALISGQSQEYENAVYTMLFSITIPIIILFIYEVCRFFVCLTKR